MKPIRVRYNRINSEIRGLLARANITAPPVPVQQVAEAAGVTIAFTELDDEVSGLLVRRGNAVVIGVAQDQSHVRQRFTIAHELGHLILHEGEEVHVDKVFRVNLRSPASSRAEDIEEIESNAFAAGLLMPEEFIRKDIARLTIDIVDSGQIEALAERYQVSAQAMTFRLLNLFGNQRRF